MTAKKPRKRIEPRVKPREFTPGARQQRARDIARALWWDSMSRQVSCTLEATIGVVGGEVTFWTGEWVKASDGRVTEEKVMVACPWVGPPLTRKEWDEWEGVPGFTAWWLSAFPTAQGLTKLDLIRLDGAFWREVSRLVERVLLRVQCQPQLRDLALQGSTSTRGCTDSRATPRPTRPRSPGTSRSRRPAPG